ncbi:MAG: hypothetical protein KJ630_09065 [Proteobacteria bacterium]|nr:hypothetical protein [Pseudomonadota bacterium]
MIPGLKLLVTIDVEEEGLFTGKYSHGEAGVENVPELSLLDPIFQSLNIRPTLLISYQVAKHKPHHDYIMKLNEKWKGEIGAHLHPWNTPPIQSLPYAHPIPSQLMPEELLRSKLETLLGALSAMGVEAQSFRMGRFSIGCKMFSILEQAGILVDSSIVPTRKEYGGPICLVAPVDPYFPDPEDLSSRGNSSVLEVPLTVLPIIPKLDLALECIAKTFPQSSSAASWFLKYIGSLPAQPMLVGINRLKMAVRLHRHRGGTTVTLYFHSSELMPGACPQHPTKRHVEKFLQRIEKFLFWLCEENGAIPMTLSECRKSCL